MATCMRFRLPLRRQFQHRWRPEHFNTLKHRHCSTHSAPSATTPPSPSPSKGGRGGFWLGVLGASIGGFCAVDYAQQHGYLQELRPQIEAVKRAIGIDLFKDTANSSSTPSLSNTSKGAENTAKFLEPQAAVISDIRVNKEECAAIAAQTVLDLQASNLDCEAACGFSQDMMQQFSYRIPSGVFLPFHQEPRSTKLAKIPATGGAIFIHCKSQSQSDCYEFGRRVLTELQSIDAVSHAEAVFGFKYKGSHQRSNGGDDVSTGLDISGVHSCTSPQESPEHRAKQALVETTGGSYLLLQQWSHKEIDPERLKQIFYESPHAHVNKVRGYHPDCSKLELVRQSLAVCNLDLSPRLRGSSAIDSTHAPGLFFVGYSKDPMVFSYMLDRMTGIPIRGGRKNRRQPDGLFQMADCVRSSVVYVPSMQQLKAIATL